MDQKCQVNQEARYACVQNGTNASWSQTFCVNVADYAGLFPFPSSFGTDSRCWSQVRIHLSLSLSLCVCVFIYIF